ncbi:ABC transporter ATP-binding protein [Spirilliplanes yamanashiensis]|uniref:Sugar ABC transporter ATP-binding protein n=1 Tax=Spirilliplanes yamanashiensis TaxID=42233 RepID=A0A8J3Y9D6_9ACTN|nr:ABC transporter ATP-binding protein [Spirilliplanes yamanashiensis]MDP9817606.1 multiple sugar transport system ATP-binding protein [Spirilliplanes yamanashiensis]GIJ04416.1 sugar ABC transporter ATP-binding protein [Spirilliplanes yamanashiensis]
MATLEITGVTTRYGKVVGVEDLDLSVGDGEFFVVLGPSGAGKTTTLKSVAGLVDIDAGRVAIAGRDLTGVEPYHRNVAMAFESYALYPQKTVFENLASPLRSGRTGSYSKADQERRIELVTTTLGINHLLQRFPRELSNGQRQRVALGRVLVRPADVYLLDEPLSHLDAKLRAAMRAELKQLGEESNTTALYVTHDYQEALDLGERIAVLRHGRLVQVGTPEQIWREPADTFVAKALGQPEINLLDAVVDDGSLVGAGAGGAVAVPVPAGLDLAAGERVRLGIRPRDIDRAGPDDRPAPGHLAVRGRVHLAERLGRLVELAVHVGDTELIMVASSDHAAEEGDLVDLHVDLADVHVFAAGAPGEDTPRLGGGVPRQRRPAEEPATGRAR